MGQQTLDQVPAGASLLMPMRLVSRIGGIATFEIISPEGNVLGQFQWSATVLSGNMTVTPAQVTVNVRAYDLKLGDIVQHIDSGVTQVVRATGLGIDQSQWSPSTGRRPLISAEGWQVIGHTAV